MVNSILNPSITYSEERGINAADIDKDGQLYEYEVSPGLVIHLAVGEYCYDHAHSTDLTRNIIYFPIYLVKDGEKIVSQIGVFEMMSVDLPNLLDAQSDIDLNNLNDPLLYSFATTEFLSKYAVAKAPKAVVQPQPEEEYVIPAQQDVDEQLLDIPLDVFEDDEEPEPLFSVDESTTWIQKLMRSSKYGIVDNEGAGDCLFACLRDAYASVGKVMSVAKLREIVASEATDELFMNYKTMYDGFFKEVNDLKITKQTVQTDAKAMSATGKAEPDRIKKKAIIGEYKKMTQYLKEITEQLNIAKENLSEFTFMKNINDLATFKKKIRTCQFWGDVWAIHTLERILKLKTIILSSENYNKDDLKNVLLCGQLDDKAPVFEPEYYVILDHTGSHYRLITYSGQSMFKFDQLPRSIKHKIVDVCMVKNAGYYNIIPEFKTLKTERMKHKLT
jgi:hypothetical protein